MYGVRQTAAYHWLDRTGTRVHERPLASVVPKEIFIKDIPTVVAAGLSLAAITFVAVSFLASF